MNTSSTLESTTSSQSTKNSPMAAPLIPHLKCSGAAEAIHFYKTAFGATELTRIPTPQGKLLHACVLINDAPVMLADEFPEHGGFSPKTLKGTPVTIHLNVPNVDEFFDRAVRAGAKVVMPVQDMFWGDRYGILDDPFGHQWSIATHQRDLTDEEIRKAAAACCG